MHKKIILSTMILFAAVTAYAQKNYEIGNPKDEANYGYLKDYAPLKDYIDYEKYPNFKLGIGTTVSNYLNNATVKGFTNDNFTETVAGNAMKKKAKKTANRAIDTVDEIITSVQNLMK